MLPKVLAAIAGGAAHVVVIDQFFVGELAEPNNLPLEDLISDDFGKTCMNHSGRLPPMRTRSIPALGHEQCDSILQQSIFDAAGMGIPTLIDLG